MTQGGGGEAVAAAGGPPAARVVSTRGAALLVVAATLLLAFGDALGKRLAETYDPVQIVWARFIFFLAPMALLLGPRRAARMIGGKDLALQCVRGALAVASAVCMIIGLRHIPLADATAILFTAPLLVTLLSWALLGEPIRWPAAAALAIGFAGVLVIVRPGGDLAWPALLPLGTALFFALYQVITTVLGRNAAPTTTLLHTGLVATALCSLAVPFFWTAPSLLGWSLLVCCGLIHGGAHFLLIQAFSLRSGGFLAPFLYCQLLGAMFIGAAMFGELPDGPSLIGSALIVLSGLMTLRGARERAARADAASG